MIKHSRVCSVFPSCLEFRFWLPYEACLFTPFSNAIANQRALFGLLFESVHNRSWIGFLSNFNMKTSYTKLRVCPLKSQFAARPSSAFQNCCRLSFGSCSRENKLSRVPFCFSKKACPRCCNSSGKVMVGTWIAGNWFRKVFRAACLIEMRRILISFFLAAS